MSEEPLFYVPQIPRLVKGERVSLRTMWGEEICVVVDVFFEDGFPMVKLTTDSGDTIAANVASVRRTACSHCPPGCPSCWSPDCECYAHQDQPDSRSPGS